MIKTFRGSMASDTQQKIRLSTNTGDMGYRIVKFQVIGENPQTEGYESVLKIFTTEPGAIDGNIDFSDPQLVAAAFLTGDHAPSQMFEQVIVVDNMKFNQDIYVTHNNTQGNGVNYYLELEQVKLDLNENTVATLKDIRNTTQ
jgi:hypothetical protein